MPKIKYWTNIKTKDSDNRVFFYLQKSIFCIKVFARGRAMVARRSHKPEVVGSSPAPATYLARWRLARWLIRIKTKS